ncbi:MAG: translation initiation factor IF-2 [Sphaerobacteraceae bacterium]|nr:MAG: translation initiation factor IF-2 [Sphaerobacteraceae bacterium]
MSKNARKPRGKGARGKNAGGPARGQQPRPQAPQAQTATVPSAAATAETIILGQVVSVGELAESLQMPPVDVIKPLMARGVMASINQQIDYDTAAAVAEELGFKVELHVPEVVEQHDRDLRTREERDSDPNAINRPPVVTIMGHVDHGKTKLLDVIRKTDVAEGEAGGITQHIGAYQVEVNGRRITFLDTPGHEAFTAMRARGAKVTDIAILVVAADDGVMPQTREAINHAQAAEVPIIVALNKIDLPQANPERVKQQLTDAGVIPEEYGGDVPLVEISAKEETGIEDLLEMIGLVSDLLELKANPDLNAVGVIVEAEIDRNRGPVATVLVQSGTLQQRDIVVVGATWGKIKAMHDDRARRVRRVLPGGPVEILGLVEAPQAGDYLQVVEDEKTARDLAEVRQRQRRAEAFSETRVVKLDDNYSAEEDASQELRLVIKADVRGSLEAIQGSLQKLNEESDSIGIRVVHADTGAVTESDVMLAQASGGVIIGFGVRPDAAAKRSADTSGVDVRYYNIIYNLVDEVRAAMSGLLKPEFREVTDGYAEVRQVFRLPNREVIAGLYILDGKAARNSKVRVLRSGTVLHDGTVSSLKRFKDDAREVQTGYECGLGVANFNNIEEGDQIEFYHIEEFARSL